jgi:hypothetical protein
LEGEQWAFVLNEGTSRVVEFDVAVGQADGEQGIDSVSFAGEVEVLLGYVPGYVVEGAGPEEQRFLKRARGLENMLKALADLLGKEEGLHRELKEDSLEELGDGEDFLG